MPRATDISCSAPPCRLYGRPATIKRPTWRSCSSRVLQHRGTSGLRHAYPEGYGVSAGKYEGGTFEPPPNFAKLAEAVNGYGEEVTELSQLTLALKRGLEHTRNHIPAVIAVRVPGPMQGAWGI